MDDHYEEFAAYLASQTEGSPVFELVSEILHTPGGIKPCEDAVTFSDPVVEPATLQLAAVIVGLPIHRLLNIFINSVQNKIEFGQVKARIEYYKATAQDLGKSIEFGEKLNNRTIEVIARRGREDVGVRELTDLIQALRGK